MKKKTLLFCLLTLFVFSLVAQPSGERKTVLFLIPFYTHEYSGNAAAVVQNSKDIYSVNSFLLMGFWAGAQIALDEYEDQNVPLNIIVKDVTDDEVVLKKILDDETLMKNVDLIIGPFFSKTFLIAAEYAKRYQIPIVNPFTNRTDILAGNDKVFKVVPSMESRPATLVYVAEQYPKCKIIMYRDSSIKSQEQEVYKNYFQKNHVDFSEVHNQKSLLDEIVTNKKNIIVSFSHNAAKMLMISRDLAYKSKSDDLMLVVPESWLQSNTYDVEYFSKLNLHFFSNYYVDNEDQQTQVFTQKFQQKFKTIPTLENFAFQGYDVTRYFVELVRNGGDLDRVKVDAIAYPMTFDKTPEGGYENVNTHFLEIRNEEIVPVTF